MGLPLSFHLASQNRTLMRRKNEDAENAKHQGGQGQAGVSHTASMGKSIHGKMIWHYRTKLSFHKVHDLGILLLGICPYDLFHASSRRDRHVHKQNPLKPQSLESTLKPI